MLEQLQAKQASAPTFRPHHPGRLPTLPPPPWPPAPASCTQDSSSVQLAILHPAASLGPAPAAHIVHEHRILCVLKSWWASSHRVATSDSSLRDPPCTTLLAAPIPRPYPLPPVPCPLCPVPLPPHAGGKQAVHLAGVLVGPVP